jgi:hypothetical protein
MQAQLEAVSAQIDIRTFFGSKEYVKALAPDTDQRTHPFRMELTELSRYLIDPLLYGAKSNEALVSLWSNRAHSLVDRIGCLQRDLPFRTLPSDSPYRSEAELLVAAVDQAIEKWREEDEHYATLLGQVRAQASYDRPPAPTPLLSIGQAPPTTATPPQAASFTDITKFVQDSAYPRVTALSEKP